MFLGNLKIRGLSFEQSWAMCANKTEKNAKIKQNWTVTRLLENNYCLISLHLHLHFASSSPPPPPPPACLCHPSHRGISNVFALLFLIGLVSCQMISPSKWTSALHTLICFKSEQKWTLHAMSKCFVYPCPIQSQVWTLCLFRAMWLWKRMMRKIIWRMGWDIVPSVIPIRWKLTQWPHPINYDTIWPCLLHT